MRSVLIAGTLILAMACTSKTANVFPGDQWEKSCPAEQGINEAGMNRALDYLKEHSKHNGNREVVIIRNGINGCTHVFINALQFARWGWLFLKEGNWWINRGKVNGAMKQLGAPQGCYFASGLNNNKCIIIPQWNMVVVRMGEDGHPDKKDIVYGTFLKLLGESLLDKN